MLDLIIRGGLVVTPEVVGERDLGIQQGRIAVLGAPGTLSSRLQPERHTVQTVAQRLSRLGGDPWDDLLRSRQRLGPAVIRRLRAIGR